LFETARKKGKNIFCHLAVAGPGSLFYLGCCLFLLVFLKLDAVLSQHCFCSFCYRKIAVLMMSMADSNQPSNHTRGITRKS